MITISRYKYDEELRKEIELPNRTIKEVYNDLCKALQEDGIIDGYLAVMNHDFDYNQPFPDFQWISCFAVTGGSEGHYVHIEIIDGDKRTLLYLGKTFEGMDHAYKIAQKCAELLGA